MAQPSDKRLCVGKVTASHGVRGEVKIRLFTESSHSFKALSAHITNAAGEPVPLSIRSITEERAIARIKGIDTREGADEIVKTDLFVAREHLPKLSDEKIFYIEDLKGLRVHNPDGERIGTVFDCVNYGAGDILEITLSNGKRELILFNDENFPEIHLAEGYVTLNPPEEIFASQEHD